MSGWTTFRMPNAGEQEHFLALWPLPEDKTYENCMNEILPPFEDLTREYGAGTMELAEFLDALGRRLPDWTPPPART